MNNWQDITMAMVSVGFSYSLIPQIIKSYRDKIVGINNQTLLITTVGCYILCFCTFTLHLYFSMCTNFITATCWLILSLMKLKFKG